MNNYIHDKEHLQQLTNEELVEIIFEMTERIEQLENELNASSSIKKKKKFENQVFPLWSPPWDK